MSPVKWRMLHVLLNDALGSPSLGPLDRTALITAREVTRDQLDLKKIPHKTHLHRKMRS